jgi:hypothetical protein
MPSYNPAQGKAGRGTITYKEYYVDKNGDIQSRDKTTSEEMFASTKSQSLSDYLNSYANMEQESLAKAVGDAQKAGNLSADEKINNFVNTQGGYNSLAQQIAGLRGQPATNMDGTKNSNIVGGLSADRNYGASDLASKLNFQVSDDDIINDYNTTKLAKLNSVVDRGNAQVAGIQQRIDTANKLLEGLPKDSPQRTTSEQYISELQSDLKSVNDAISTANTQIKDFKPITAQDPSGLKEITAFREYVKLPEERAGEQLKQIDPEAYKTAVGLGQQYRKMATEDIGATTTPQTEALRNTLEQEAVNQLRLGSTLGAEERRGYEQAARAAQTARGNIFGLGPAVQEAAQIGAAGEARKLARYGAAQQFLASGQSTGDALRSDLAFRDALLQNRLGAAAGFVASGPSLYNLGNARLANQQGQFQNYVNANQAQPGQFNTQPYASQFYQTTNPAIPVQMSGQAANIYNTMSNYQAQTYGDYTRAVASQPSGAQQFGAIASGIGSLIPNIAI